MLVVAGPTGAGKSALALALAQKFAGEIVNCDSLQLYRQLDIGTAKPSLQERQTVPHHLFDVLSLPEGFSAGEFGQMARPVIQQIAQRGHLPIVAGGTGFYLKALLDGLPVLPTKDNGLRARLMMREQKRPGALHRLLRRLDAKSAPQIHFRDIQKLLRALEVRILTGRPRAEAQTSAPLENFRTLKIGLDPDRGQLRTRLEARTKRMFNGGLVDEVRSLLNSGATGNEKPFESLGYKQALQHVRGAIMLEQAIESTLIETRQYAKRQRTWFRRDPEFKWLTGFGDSAETLDEGVALVEEWLG